MLSSLVLRNSKKNLVMAESKLLMYVAYALGVPSYIFALYVNLGTWKSDILFAAGLCVLAFNVYWRYRRNIRADRKSAQEEEQRRLELWEKQIELQERQREIYKAKHK
jgi:cyanate permease